jgi:opacity protein-like surface antigen
LKKWIALGIYFVAGTTCLAGDISTTGSNLPGEGFFLGLGANYNSINLTQNSWGKGISNIQTSTGANSNGVGEGNGAPFHNIINTLSPNFQAGYFKHITGTPNLYGVKFFYQYLDATATNSNLYIPQLGQSTNANTGVTSSLYGYVNADSVQPTINQQIALLLFAGHSFGNTSIYFGAGPSLINLKSKNYYSIGYAEFEGATINVTGLVSYSSPSFWAFGATAQIGATYFFTPCWFVDASYTYTLTGDNTKNHQQGFTNSSNLGGTIYATSGTLFTKDTISLKNQSLMLSINKVF